MNDLRDHNQPCEHDSDRYWEGTQERRVYQCNGAACPGGRQVTLPEDVPEWWRDHDAHAIFGKSFHSIEAGWRYFRHLWIDAAIGDTEVEPDLLGMW